MLWIRPDPDPAFYLSVDPDLDPCQTFKSQKVEFLHEKYALKDSTVPPLVTKNNEVGREGDYH